MVTHVISNPCGTVEKPTDVEPQSRLCKITTYQKLLRQNKNKNKQINSNNNKNKYRRTTMLNNLMSQRRKQKFNDKCLHGSISKT